MLRIDITTTKCFVQRHEKDCMKTWKERLKKEHEIESTVNVNGLMLTVAADIRNSFLMTWTDNEIRMSELKKLQ